MASNLTAGGVFRRSEQSVRYNPYNTRTSIALEKDLEEEVIRLGIELSLFVSESMFLLCDDHRTMLCFCFKLWRRRVLYRNPVSDRLLRVIHYVYTNYIKPKNGVFRDDGTSVQWELIKTAWEDFAAVIIILYRIFVLLRRKNSCTGFVWPAIGRHKQMMQKLEDKLMPAKDVAVANGFLRETVESNISVFWKSLFDEETGGEVIRDRIISDLFQPILGDSRHREKLALPVCRNYVIGYGFVKEGLEEDVVQLGVELSLLVAQSMFLLCDDIRTVLWSCLNLWRYVRRNQDPPGSQVVVRLLYVMHYVYLKYIKPKNGVYQIGGKSVHQELIRTTWESVAIGFRSLDLLVQDLRGEGSCGQNLMSSIEKELKKAEEKLECVKAVSEVNGFARDAMECQILDLWKSILDKEGKEATWTLKVIKTGILRDLFLPVLNELVPQP